MKIPGISKGNYYYKAVPESEEDLRICELIDKEHLEHPTASFRYAVTTHSGLLCPIEKPQVV